MLKLPSLQCPPLGYGKIGLYVFWLRKGMEVWERSPPSSPATVLQYFIKKIIIYFRLIL